jgi:hypothetical protein
MQAGCRIAAQLLISIVQELSKQPCCSTRRYCYHRSASSAPSSLHMKGNEAPQAVSDQPHAKVYVWLALATAHSSGGTLLLGSAPLVPGRPQCW